MIAPVMHVSNILGFRSVVVITCASHAQGPRFEPERNHPFNRVCSAMKSIQAFFQV